MFRKTVRRQWAEIILKEFSTSTMEVCTAAYVHVDATHYGILLSGTLLYFGPMLALGLYKFVLYKFVQEKKKTFT